MANNSVIYNAAFSGALGAIEAGRMIRSVQAADYDSVELTAATFAIALDSLIPTNTALTQADGDLMLSCCLSVMFGRFAKSTNNLTASINAIVALFNSVRASLVTVTNAGTQAVWAVNATTGNDAAAGGTLTPLRTVAELSRRLKGITLTVSTVITLTGTFAQTDVLSLQDIFCYDEASITINGVVTPVQSGIVISSVTAIGAGTTQPWTIVTTGIDWTLQTARRVTLSGGQTGWIGQVVNANTIVCSHFNVTPTNAMTMTLETTSSVNNFAGNVYAQGRSNAQAVTLQINKVLVQDLKIGTPVAVVGPSGVVEVAPLVLLGMPQYAFTRCDVSTGILNAVNATFNFCQIHPFSNLTSTRLECFQSNFLNFQGCSFVPLGSTSTSVVSNQCNLQFGNCYAENVAFAFNGCQVTHSAGMNIRNCVAAVLPYQLDVLSSAKCTSNAAILAGAGNLAAQGLTVNNSAKFIYFQAAGKPTITAVADTLVGGTAKAYAAIPFLEPANGAQINVGA